MATLRQSAEEFTPAQTHNIADLGSVPIDEVEMLNGEGTNTDGEKFYYKYFVLDGKEYRTPNSVIEEIQKIIKLKPEIKNVRVTKSGTGLSTRYRVDAINA